MIPRDAGRPTVSTGGGTQGLNGLKSSSFLQLVKIKIKSGIEKKNFMLLFCSYILAGNN